MTQIKHIQDDNRVFIDMPTSDENPCLDCGVCCAHFRISFYCGELSGENNGFVPEELTTALTTTMACMKGTECGNKPCIALGGKIGEKIWCKIYENRPTPCREYPVWLEDGTPNPDCQRLRKKFGLPLLNSKK